MKFILAIACLFAFVISAHAKTIVTTVYVEKSSGDQSGGVEMVTYIKESGNGQLQSKTETASLPANTNFAGEGPFGKGRAIASATFTGTSLPAKMLVTVYEDDGSSSADDGVCSIDIEAAFSTKSTWVRCVREDGNGRAVSWIINARITEVLPSP